MLKQLDVLHDSGSINSGASLCTPHRRLFQVSACVRFHKSNPTPGRRPAEGAGPCFGVRARRLSQRHSSLHLPWPSLRLLPSSSHLSLPLSSLRLLPCLGFCLLSLKPLLGVSCPVAFLPCCRLDPPSRLLSLCLSCPVLPLAVFPLRPLSTAGHAYADKSISFSGMVCWQSPTKPEMATDFQVSDLSINRCIYRSI